MYLFYIYFPYLWTWQQLTTRFQNDAVIHSLQSSHLVRRKKFRSWLPFSQGKSVKIPEVENGIPLKSPIWFWWFPSSSCHFHLESFAFSGLCLPLHPSPERHHPSAAAWNWGSPAYVLSSSFVFEKNIHLLFPVLFYVFPIVIVTFSKWCHHLLRSFSILAYSSDIGKFGKIELGACTFEIWVGESALAGVAGLARLAPPESRPPGVFPPCLYGP